MRILLKMLGLAAILAMGLAQSPAEARASKANSSDEDGKRSKHAQHRSHHKSHAVRHKDDDEKPSRKRQASRGSSGGGGQTGIASFYHEPQMTASGERFNPNAMTAAHRTLPLGSIVRVTHAGTGRSVNVRINDRGPYAGGRVIDLSRAAANAIGISSSAGLGRVHIERIR